MREGQTSGRERPRSVDPPALPRSPGRRFEVLGLDLLDLLEMSRELASDPVRSDLVVLGFNRGTGGLKPTLVATDQRDQRDRGTEGTKGVKDGCKVQGCEGSKGHDRRSNEG
jgi:hypothetical protein